LDFREDVNAGSLVAGNTLLLGISVTRGSPALDTHLVYEQAPDGRPEDEPYDEVHISHERPSSHTTLPSTQKDSIQTF
jgi:hypothetical protein